MLENIKSTLFEKIFSYVEEKTKLDILKYNKNHQRKINISLINYKLFNGHYIIYEEKGRGKEYNQFDELIYEGEYINGKRNGKGKGYYYSGEVSYEGEYLNGKKMDCSKIIMLRVNYALYVNIKMEKKWKIQKIFY